MSSLLRRFPDGLRPRSRGRLSTLLTAAIMAGLCLPFGVAEVRAASIPTTTTVTGPAEPADKPDLVFVTVRVSPAPQAQDGFIPGVFVFEGDRNIGGGPISPDGTVVEAVDVGPGSHVIHAVFSGFNDYEPSQSAPITIEVGSATATTLTSSREPALHTQEVTFTATVAGKLGNQGPADAPVGGTLIIVDTTTDATLGSLGVTADARTLAVSTKLSLGSHVLEARYSGVGLFRASSVQLTQSIEADQTVDAGGVSSTPATFYPIVDGYKDTNSIRGVRNEPISVLIRIYSVSSGKVVRSANVGVASGSYAWTWNGRSTSGALQPAGKYRIVQTLTDTAANKLTVTTYTNVSRKRLYYHTATITKNGNAYSIYGDHGDGSISRARSSYSRGVRLSSGHSWVGVSYSFSLPSATVYKSITFKVLGRSPNGTRATIGIWNPNWGSYRYGESYSQAKAIGPRYAWHSTSGPGSALHQGRTARAMIDVEYGPGGKSFDVAKVQLVVRYAVLR